MVINLFHGERLQEGFLTFMYTCVSLSSRKFSHQSEFRLAVVFLFVLMTACYHSTLASFLKSKQFNSHQSHTPPLHVNTCKVFTYLMCLLPLLLTLLLQACVTGAPTQWQPALYLEPRLRGPDPRSLHHAMDAGCQQSSLSVISLNE